MGSANGCCKSSKVVEQKSVPNYQNGGANQNRPDANSRGENKGSQNKSINKGGHDNSAYDNGPGGGPFTITVVPPTATSYSNQSKVKNEMATLQIQKPAPQFKGTAVVNGEFKEISLEDYKGKYVVLFFYPLDFTFVCPTEIIAFSDAADKFREINCQVVAASTDSHFSHFAWVTTPRKQGGLGQMNIPLLADKTGDIARSYGIYKEDEGIAFRGLFIIDGKQNLRQITVNDLPVGRSVEETLRLVQAFQFTDKHGEVCPANWKPGNPTIKPNVADSKAFFENS